MIRYRGDNMYELYESRNSIYCYPNSNVLINKFNIQDNDKLFEIERKIVLAKLYELRQNNQIFNFDIHHFVGIHEFLFEDIYPFAGLFRTENIAKGNFSFAQWQFIDKELIKLLNELKQENYLKGLDIKDMAKRLAYYMAELNVLHPFREGNGRTIREFTRQIAFNAGYILDTQNIDAHEILNACIKSVVDPTDLENILLNCLSLK